MVSYSAEDFVAALSSEEGLSLPTPPVIQTGLVDPNVRDGETIRFAAGMQCSNWIEVPVGIIDKVDYLGNQPCGQHEYPYVRLHLQPTTDEGRVLASLLQSGTTLEPTPPVPMAPVPVSSMSSYEAPPTSSYEAPPMGTYEALPMSSYEAPPMSSYEAALIDELPRGGDAPDARPGLDTPGPISGCK
jgi:hypothetical protein